MGVYPNTGKNYQYLWSSSTNSPYGKLTYNKGTNKRYRTLGTIFGEYQIIKGLSFRTSVNFDNTDNIATTYVPYTTVGTGYSHDESTGAIVNRQIQEFLPEQIICFLLLLEHIEVTADKLL